MQFATASGLDLVFGLSTQNVTESLKFIQYSDEMKLPVFAYTWGNEQNFTTEEGIARVASDLAQVRRALLRLNSTGARPLLGAPDPKL